MPFSHPANCRAADGGPEYNLSLLKRESGSASHMRVEKGGVMKQAERWGVAALTGVVVLMTLGGCGNDSQDRTSAPQVAPAPTSAASAVVPPPAASSAMAASSASRTNDSSNQKVAGFDAPSGITVDDDGNLYVADTGNNVIRRVGPSGEMSTLAGTPGVAGHADGEGTAATFDHPGGIAIDRARNLYVADTGNNTIRKITPAGVVTTLAGSAKSDTGSADGIGTAARFEEPGGIAVDRLGNIYVTDRACTIRKITPGGKVATLAGNPDDRNRSRDGAGGDARFDSPGALAIDKNGTLYVVDQDKLRKVTPDGKVTTLNPVDQSIIDANASMGDPGKTEAFAHQMEPYSLAVKQGTGDVYIAEQAYIRVMTKEKNLATFTGMAENTPGSSDGNAKRARFDSPRGLAFDKAGNLYVADTGNNIIRKVAPDGTTTTLAGTPKTAGKP